MRNIVPDIRISVHSDRQKQEKGSNKCMPFTLKKAEALKASDNIT